VLPEAPSPWLRSEPVPLLLLPVLLPVLLPLLDAP
jgi:hypothetical protein